MLHVEEKELLTKYKCYFVLGRRVAAVVYFTLPIVGGCMLMERVMQYSEDHKVSLTLL